MVLSDKPEYPALLPQGLHPISTRALQRMCVGAFPLSQTRESIMRGLDCIVERLESAGFEGELWLNGSFLTEKIDPQDVDIVLRLSGEFYDRMSPSQSYILKWWVQTDLFPGYCCDTYFFVDFKAGDPRQNDGDRMRRYWLDLFGTSRVGDPKGIGVLHLPQSVSGFTAKGF